MTEILAAISSEVQTFLDSDRVQAQRDLSRTAIIQSGGVDIEIAQHKYLAPDDLARLRVEGPEALATTAWFNDVDMKQTPDDRGMPYRQLNLDARYPMAYFDEAPTTGHFIDDDWQDQYGSISGFGSAEEINTWLLEFVAQDGRDVTRLRYPEDPTAIDQYNARFRQYLETLDQADPTISYYRGWDHCFSDLEDKTGTILGGMSLAGMGLNDVIRQGTGRTEDTSRFTRLLFHFHPEQGEYVGRDIIITDDRKAVTEPYWDGEDELEPASDELLETALQLVKKLNAEVL